MNPSNVDYETLIDADFFPIGTSKLDFQNMTILDSDLISSKWNSIPCMVKVTPPDKWSDDKFYLTAKLIQLVGTHPNCLGLYGVTGLRNPYAQKSWKFGTPPPYVLITEPGVRGNVKNFLQQQSQFQLGPGQLDHHLIVKIALGVVRGTRHLETFDGSGRDLVRSILPDYIYLKQDLTPLIEKYGTSSNLSEAIHATQGINLRKYIRYVPPEAIKMITPQSKLDEFKYLRASDIWHIGIFLLEICTGKFREFMAGSALIEIIRKLDSRAIISIPDECHPSMKRIIQLCLNYDFIQRLQEASLDKIEKMLEQHYHEVRPSRTVPSSLYYDFSSQGINQPNLSPTRQQSLVRVRPHSIVSQPF